VCGWADRRCRRGGGERGDGGETLIEILLAVTILSLVGVGAFAGLATTMGVSAEQRPATTAEATLRSAAERLQDPETDYVDCAGPTSYLPELPPLERGYGLATSVAYWAAGPMPAADTQAYTPEFVTTCSGSDAGLQLITVTLTDPSGDAQRLDVVKRRP